MRMGIKRLCLLKLLKYQWGKSNFKWIFYAISASSAAAIIVHFNSNEIFSSILSVFFNKYALREAWRKININDWLHFGSTFRLARKNYKHLFIWRICLPFELFLTLHASAAVFYTHFHFLFLFRSTLTLWGYQNSVSIRLESLW